MSRSYYEYEVTGRTYKLRYVKAKKEVVTEKVEARSNFDAELEFHKLHPKKKVIKVVRGEKTGRRG